VQAVVKRIGRNLHSPRGVLQEASDVLIGVAVEAGSRAGRARGFNAYGGVHRGRGIVSTTASRLMLAYFQ
jgi:hypothetical protein